MKQRYYNGILLGLTFLFLCYGARGYQFRYNQPLQEDSPVSRSLFSDGTIPVLLIINKGLVNPAEALKEPPPSCGNPLRTGFAEALLPSALKEEVRLIAFDDFSRSVYIEITSTDLIFPFHDFL